MTNHPRGLASGTAHDDHTERSGVLRYSAFDVDGQGGNPAGVVLDARHLDDARMQEIAAEVGFSETAFLVEEGTAGEGPVGGDRRFRIRYFSPLDEVAFCGHATIATAVALAERDGVGNLLLGTSAGEVAVETRHEDGRVVATLTSVTPVVRAADEDDLAEALRALRWEAAELDPALPPRVANAGNDHLVLAAATRERLADLDYDQKALGELMARRGWTTVHLVWRETPTVFHARDPFPPGGVYEDPATGAAAAAFGAYLRALGLVEPPVRVTVRQGEDMGRPSRLLVDLAAGATTGVRVSGTAVLIDPADLVS
ncbi:PhzF family phenazine biosynthesis protein [Nonomuraea roseoviolacea]|uniref:PhzF family phenazine biosynthesis protein n=1 Tax=Nonomuraea roseoviolacea subsp. carminata TaxID=160689 RepID=A0ABT1JZW1_9ACTN|nr:PhzF family phenazine biosynthesis isomerase [Nonomuraea roseoviolacea]MCP2347291.1 PhzF family phenazine biosynthesis protein [Nonomuraea roseoviolacea subsp. carminata]